MTSCSFFDSTTTKAIDLPPEILSAALANNSTSPLYGWVELGTDQVNNSDTPLYSKKVASGISIYLTALEHCGSNINPKRDAASIIRQLFVGFDQVLLDKVEPISNPTVRGSLSFVSASLDGEPLNLAVASTITPGCIHDFVVWAPGNTVSSSGAKLESETLKSLLQNEAELLTIKWVGQHA